MRPAARVGDPTAHPGVITGPGVGTVIIEGLPAAVVGDSHVCGDTNHAPGTIVSGSSSVTIGGRPAARVGDTSSCGAAIFSGASSVMIGG